MGIKLNYSERSLEQLDEFFPRIVIDDQQDNGELPSKTSRPSPEAFSLCNDIGMYLGEMLRQCSSTLHWELLTWNKRDVYYHRPVILGFSKVKNRNFSVDFYDMLCGYAFRLVRGRGRQVGLIPKMYKEHKRYA